MKQNKRIEKIKYIERKLDRLAKKDINVSYRQFLEEEYNNPITEPSTKINGKENAIKGKTVNRLENK